MILKDIRNQIANKCNVDEDDEQALAVINLGINDGYKEILKVDTLVTTAKIPVIRGRANLPENVSNVLKIEPELENGDKIEGRTIITSTSAKLLDVTYIYFPDELIEDDSEPEIAPKNHSLLITYGCFAYYQFKKKMEIANSYFSSFQRGLDTLRTEHFIPSKIEEVYRL